MDTKDKQGVAVAGLFLIPTLGFWVLFWFLGLDGEQGTNLFVVLLVAAFAWTIYWSN